MKTTHYKVLTVCQPYASLIMAGLKLVENRALVDLQAEQEESI